MRLIIGLLVGVSCFGQSITLSGPSVARAGSSINIVVNFAPGTSVVAASQWVLQVPNGWSVTNAVVGTMGVTVGKLVSCTADKVLCLLYGQNTTAFSSGVAITYTVQLPPNPAFGNTLIPLNGIVMASPVGDLVPLVGNQPGVNMVVKKKLGDINGDGIVDNTDVSLMAQMILDARVDPNKCTEDQNNDNVCDVRDLIIVIINRGNP